MQSLKKILALLVLSGSVISSASHAQPAPDGPKYSPKTQNLMMQSQASVIIENDSYDSWDDLYPDYWVSATYYPIGNTFRSYLGPMGYPTGRIEYTMGIFNTKVCLDVDANDAYLTHVSYACYYPGAFVRIYYPQGFNANEKPSSLKALVEVVKAK
jgi:hypothetical protein